jgi:hypothetical protein
MGREGEAFEDGEVRGGRIVACTAEIGLLEKTRDQNWTWVQ